MKNYIKQNFSKIINLYIILQPIFDLITGISINTFHATITIGIILRFLFLLFLFYCAIIYQKKHTLYTYLIIVIYSLFYLGGIIYFKDGVVFKEIQGLVKAFYFPLILISLYDLKDEYKINKQTLFTTLLIYLLLIFIPTLLGIGYESYEIAKKGTLGFFNSANSISGIISLLTPIMFIMIKQSKNKILGIICLLIYLSVILMIGTKTPLLTLFLTIGVTYIYYFIIWIKQKNIKPIIYSTSIIIIGLSSLILILPKTNFYKNIKIHLDYLEVDNILDVLKDKKLIDHFIFSQRLTFLENRAEIYSESSTYEKIFGIGYTKDNKSMKLIEIDYFDILYSHGIIGFIIVFTIFNTVLINIIKNKQEKSYEKAMIKFSLFLIILLSFFTGHIITSPDVSIFATILILLLIKKEKKDLMFSANDMTIGGIENALINLLNVIDYDKYNVTLILEKKDGALLKRVNKNVKIEELKVSNCKNTIVRKIINLTRKLNFILFNYHNYDFSCCYATYSLSGNILARLASNNNSIYIHSNYRQLYPKENDFKEFFNTRKIDKFRKIIFVSNEAKNDFLKIYKELKNKTIVINNFVDIEYIKRKSKEKISIPKKSNQTLFVFVGRLDDTSKKVKRAINIAKAIDNIELWIIGSGPDEKMYKDYVKENNLEDKVLFLGKKENPYPYMKKADYIILTSEYEGFPVVYQEAIILQKPIITTIPVSDEEINIGKDYGNIISKDQTKMINEVNKILKNKHKEKNIDLEKIQKTRYKELEKLFSEVV